MVTIAYNCPLAANRFRRLAMGFLDTRLLHSQWPLGSKLPWLPLGATPPDNFFSFIFGLAPSRRKSLYFPLQVQSFLFLAPRVRHAVSFLVTERMRLFLNPVIHNFRFIPLGFCGESIGEAPGFRSLEAIPLRRVFYLS